MSSSSSKVRREATPRVRSRTQMSWVRQPRVDQTVGQALAVGREGQVAVAAGGSPSRPRLLAGAVHPHQFAALGRAAGHGHQDAVPGHREVGLAAAHGADVLGHGERVPLPGAVRQVQAAGHERGAGGGQHQVRRRELGAAVHRPQVDGVAAVQGSQPELPGRRPAAHADIVEEVAPVGQEARPGVLDLVPAAVHGGGGRRDAAVGGHLADGIAGGAVEEDDVRRGPRMPSAALRVSHTSWGGPPATATFFSWPPRK